MVHERNRPATSPPTGRGSVFEAMEAVRRDGWNEPWKRHACVLGAKIDLLTEALRECEIEIDNYIDLETPRGVHPRWDSENTRLKELNPARLVLQGKKV